MNRNEERMNQLREEYRKVQYPKDGLKQLEHSISRAKKDKKRTQKVRFIRRLTAGVAAAFAGVFVMVNVNSDFAYAMGQIPVLGKAIKVITLERYQADETYYTADIKSIKLEAEEDAPGINDVNKAVKKDRDAVIEECRKMFETDAADYSEDPSVEGMTSHYSIEADYEVVTDTEDYFVLRFWTVMTGGSAQQIEKYYTIDRKTGEMLKLADLFKKDSDYITVVSENIKEQMKQQMDADENVKYWLDDPEVPEWNFEKIKENQNFYVNAKGNLVISFDEFEVAPGYMGAVTFEIPKEAIASIWK